MTTKPLLQNFRYLSSNYVMSRFLLRMQTFKQIYSARRKKSIEKNDENERHYNRNLSALPKKVQTILYYWGPGLYLTASHILILISLNLTKFLLCLNVQGACLPCNVITRLAIEGIKHENKFRKGYVNLLQIIHCSQQGLYKNLQTTKFIVRYFRRRKLRNGIVLVVVNTLIIHTKLFILLTLID